MLKHVKLIVKWEDESQIEWSIYSKGSLRKIEKDIENILDKLDGKGGEE